MRIGYSKHQVLDSFKEALEDNSNKDISSLWPVVLFRLREDLVYRQVKTVGKEISRQVLLMKDMCQRWLLVILLIIQSFHH